MTQQGYEYPPGGPGEFDLLDKVNCLDQQRAVFFEETARFIGLPTKTNLERLQNSVRLCADKMRETFVGVLGSGQYAEAEDKASMIAHLLLDEDTKRVNYFNDLLGEDEFKTSPYDQDSLTSFLKGMLENEEADEDEEDIPAIDMLMHMYRDSYQIDMNKLLEQAGQTRNGKFLNAGRIIARHSLEVAKIGAGVAGGIWLSRKFKD